jgi:SAM-dependent methyltransferase
MRREFIDTLHCPYTGSRLLPSKVLEEGSSGITYGVLTSEAGEFPVIDGILRLKVDEYRRPLVDLIQQRKHRDALMVAMEVPTYGRGGATLNFLERTAINQGLNSLAHRLTQLKRSLTRVLTDETETLAGTVNKLRSKSWANWQIYRYTMPAFLPTYPLLHLIDGGGPVLDFGCGLGHASFLISRRVPASEITCSDYVFSLLYIAKKFFASGANFICLNGNYLLPFASSYFSSVFSSDVLHLIDSKLSLSAEFRRVVSDDGTILLPHLHNKMSPVKFAQSLTPKGYGTLFEGIEKRVVPEDWLVDQFVQDDSLDLKKEWTSEELDGAIKGLSIAISKNSSLFRCYKGLWAKHADAMSSPIVNPLYRVSGEPKKWLLKRENPDSAGKLTSRADIYLPDSINLDLPALDKQTLLALKASDRQTFADLARKFVIIEAPQRFLQE